MKNLMKWALLLVTSLLITSCGGGGGGGDDDPAGTPTPDANSTMTVTVVSPSAGTTTTTFTGAFNTLEPTLFAWSGINNGSMVEMNSPSSSQMVVSIAAVTPGIYTQTDAQPQTYLRYVRYDSSSNPPIYASTNSTITLTAVGNTGELITGSFEGDFYRSFPVEDRADTLHISGTFSVEIVF